MLEVNRGAAAAVMAGVVIMEEDQIRVLAAGVVDLAEIAMVVEGVPLMVEEGDMEIRAAKLLLHMVQMLELGDMEARSVLLLPMVPLVAMQVSTQNHSCLQLLLEEAMQTHLLADMVEHLIMELQFHLLVGMVPRMFMRHLIAMVRLVISVHKEGVVEEWDLRDTIAMGQKNLVDIQSQGQILRGMIREM